MPCSWNSWFRVRTCWGRILSPECFWSSGKCRKSGNFYQRKAPDIDEIQTFSGEENSII